MAEGLDANSCVSDDYELARYYAEYHEDPVIICLLISIWDLRVDTNAIEEPIRCGSAADKHKDVASQQDMEFDHVVWRSADIHCEEVAVEYWSELSGRDSLQLTNSARTAFIETEAKFVLSDWSLPCRSLCSPGDLSLPRA